MEGLKSQKAGVEQDAAKVERPTGERWMKSKTSREIAPHPRSRLTVSGSVAHPFAFFASRRQAGALDKSGVIRSVRAHLDPVALNVGALPIAVVGGVARRSYRKHV